MKRVILAVLAVGMMVFCMCGIAHAENYKGTCAGAPATVEGNIEISESGSCDIKHGVSATGSISVTASGSITIEGGIESKSSTILLEGTNISTDEITASSNLTVKSSGAVKVSGEMKSGGDLEIESTEETEVKGEIQATYQVKVESEKSIKVEKEIATTTGNILLNAKDGTLKVEGNITSKGGYTVILQSKESMSLKNIEANGTLNGTVRIFANEGHSGSEAFKIGSAGATNGVGHIYDNTESSSRAGGIYITNGGSGGIAYSGENTLESDSSGGQGGFVILDSREKVGATGPITLSGKINEDGSGSHLSGVITVLASEVKVTGESSLTADQTEAAGTTEQGHYIDLVTDKLKLESNLELQVKGNGTYPTYDVASVSPNGSAEIIATSNPEEGITDGVEPYPNSNEPLTTEGSGKLSMYTEGKKNGDVIWGNPLKLGKTLIDDNGSGNLVSIDSGNGWREITYNKLTFTGAVEVFANEEEKGATANEIYVRGTEIAKPEGRVELNAQGVKGGNGSTVQLVSEKGELFLGGSGNNITLNVSAFEGEGSAGTAKVYGGKAKVKIEESAFYASSFEGNSNAATVEIYGNTIESVKEKVALIATGHGSGKGGHFKLQAEGTLSLGGKSGELEIETAGEASGGGGLVELSGSEVKLNGGYIFLTPNKSGPGGEFKVTNTGTLKIGNETELKANGKENGAGGRIELNANTIEFESGSYASNMSANGEGTGAGGTIKFESKSATFPGTISGTISANGGASGNGGTIEFYPGTGTFDFGSSAGDLTFSATGGSTTGNGGKLYMKPEGKVTVSGSSALEVSALGKGNGGTIELHAGELLFSGSSTTVAANAKSTGIGGTIALESKEHSIVLGTASGDAKVEAKGEGSSGNGGKIELNAKEITLNAADVSVSAGTSGNGGTIKTESSGKQKISKTELAASGKETGNGGEISLTGSELEFESEGKVTADAGTTGNGGKIYLDATSGNIVTGTSSGDVKAKATGAGSEGNGGAVEIKGKEVSLTNADVSVTAGTSGNGGTIKAESSGKLKITKTELAASGKETGNGGEISLTGSELEFESEGKVTADAGTTGNGGKIYLHATSGNIVTGTSSGDVKAKATGAGSSGNGGSIELKGKEISLTDADVSVTAGTSGNGGKILANGSGKVLVTKTELAANGKEKGNGGEISLTGAPLEFEGEGKVTADAGTTGNGGNIYLESTSGNIVTGTSSGDVKVKANGAGSEGNGGKIEFNAKEISLNAADVSVSAGTSGNGGTIKSEASGKLKVSKTELAANGKGDGNGGEVSLKASEIEFEGKDTKVSTNGEGTGNGGTIELNATEGSVDLSSTAEDGVVVSADAGSDGFGGTFRSNDKDNFTLNNGTLNVQNSSPGKGGSVEIIAKKLLTVESGTTINLNADSEGNGGFLKLESESIKFEGSASTFEANGANNGNGGEILLRSQSTINVGSTSNSVKLKATGAGTGNGGVVEVKGSTLTVNSANVSVAGGKKGSGGKIYLGYLDSALKIEGNLEANAGPEGNGSGGLIQLLGSSIEATGANSKLSAVADGTGQGGRIELFSTSKLSIGELSSEFTLQTAGKGSGGGGYISIAGSEVSVNGNAVSLTPTEGNAGEITVEATGELTVLHALEANGAVNGDGGGIHLKADSIALEKPTIRADGAGTGTGGEVNLEPTEVLEISSADLEEISAKGGETGEGGAIYVSSAKPAKTVEAIDVNALLKAEGGKELGPEKLDGVIRLNGVLCKQWKTPYTGANEFPKTYWNCINGESKWPFAEKVYEAAKLPQTELQKLLLETKSAPQNPSVQIYVMSIFSEFPKFFGFTESGNHAGYTNFVIRVSALFEYVLEGLVTTVSGPKSPGFYAVHELGHELQYMFAGSAYQLGEEEGYTKAVSEDVTAMQSSVCEDYFFKATCAEARFTFDTAWEVWTTLYPTEKAIGKSTTEGKEKDKELFSEQFATFEAIQTGHLQYELKNEEQEKTLSVMAHSYGYVQKVIKNRTEFPVNH